MKKRYFEKDQAVNDYKVNINEMLNYFNGKPVVSVEELKKMVSENDRLYTELMVQSMALKKKIKNSIILKGHYEKKRAAVREELNRVSAAFDAQKTAVEVCEILQLKDTSSLKAEMFTDEIVSGIIDYKIEQELKQNAEAEKNGDRKSNKYVGINEPFNESDYPIFEIMDRE